MISSVFTFHRKFAARVISKRENTRRAVGELMNAKSANGARSPRARNVALYKSANLLLAIKAVYKRGNVMYLGS